MIIDDGWWLLMCHPKSQNSCWFFTETQSKWSISDFVQFLLVGGLNLTLWKIGVHQLGLWNSLWKKRKCSKPMTNCVMGRYLGEIFFGKNAASGPSWENDHPHSMMKYLWWLIISARKPWWFRHTCQIVSEKDDEKMMIGCLKILNDKIRFMNGKVVWNKSCGKTQCHNQSY